MSTWPRTRLLIVTLAAVLAAIAAAVILPGLRTSNAGLWGAKTALAASDLQLPEAAGGSTGREAGLRSMRGTR
jgi:hypothetical protein